jgi:ribosome biogenesis GTPase
LTTPVFVKSPFWNDDDGISAAFPEIENLAGECRFSNCSHIHEPGCRVLQAVSDGEILQGTDWKATTK